ncbi:hypothetical protein DAEQUDRAFT_741395 [Daedalea quercina L-15889]|uniref:Uncharacterized protein n=1 Tax=Daedalea quercina L-15889 TaxID=1314783 RepID=A0A165LDN5_9APHY|nr:hypothetical protein DAEQUDRAFT_741395 [Daedalea quercina L-15889]
MSGGKHDPSRYLRYIAKVEREVSVAVIPLTPVQPGPIIEVKHRVLQVPLAAVIKTIEPVRIVPPEWVAQTRIELGRLLRLIPRTLPASNPFSCIAQSYFATSGADILFTLPYGISTTTLSTEITAEQLRSRLRSTTHASLSVSAHVKETESRCAVVAGRHLPAAARGLIIFFRLVFELGAKSTDNAALFLELPFALMPASPYDVGDVTISSPAYEVAEDGRDNTSTGIRRRPRHPRARGGKKVQEAKARKLAKQAAEAEIAARLAAEVPDDNTSEASSLVARRRKRNRNRNRTLQSPQDSAQGSGTSVEAETTAIPEASTSAAAHQEAISGTGPGSTGDGTAKRNRRRNRVPRSTQDDTHSGQADAIGGISKTPAVSTSAAAQQESANGSTPSNTGTRRRSRNRNHTGPSTETNTQDGGRSIQAQELRLNDSADIAGSGAMRILDTHLRQVVGSEFVSVPPLRLGVRPRRRRDSGNRAVAAS